ncbi:triose-phosphate isomerase [candidate division KSB1 bacterium]|nr:MAG: triose-phosphate isomerase [candidate division KSB1 bacterium]
MRKKLVAGNWKMNMNVDESRMLAEDILKKLGDFNEADVVLCPPFTSIETVHKIVEDSIIEVGAQNLYYEKSGAFTGEISADMLVSAGCKYVILGHSERREYFNETDKIINKKIKTALESELIPVLCIGEKLKQREQGITDKVIRNQFDGCLNGIFLEKPDDLIIAYEPVWAIGTGKNATPEQAEEVHILIRGLVSKKYTTEIAENLRILYGGSVKPENARSLFSMNDIDGGLIGGASLKADSFVSIIKSI